MEKMTDLADTLANCISADTVTSDFKFPPMPANGTRLMRLVQQPVEQIDTEELVKLLETDPGLYSMVLQTANSAYYKGMATVISLRAAINRVGLDEVVDAVNFYFFRGVFPKPPQIKEFPPKAYWAFSWACAAAAKRLGHPNLGLDALPGELYLSGLLHGIGKLVFALKDPELFSTCIQLAANLRQPLYVMERREFGTSDSRVASKLMEIWGLPPRIIAGVRYCQEPETAPKGCGDIAGAVQYAYSLASQAGIGTNGDGVSLLPETTWLATSPRTPIGKPMGREAVNREILCTLEEKSLSITGVNSRTSQKQQIRSAADALPPVHSLRSGHSKKGLVAWIKSFFCS